MRARVLPIAAVALLAQPAVAQAPAPIVGRWIAEDGTAVVTIAPCGAAMSTYCGRVSRFLVAEPKGGFRDARNPDPKLRGQPVLGKTVFTGLVAKGKAWKGRGYSVKDGRHFSATLSAAGDRLTLRGCVTIVCRTVVWTRA